MIKKSIISAIATFLMLLLATMPVQAALPESFDFGKNFYTVSGGPDLDATLIGDNRVFQRKYCYPEYRTYEQRSDQWFQIRKGC